MLRFLRREMEAAECALSLAVAERERWRRCAAESRRGAEEALAQLEALHEGVAAGREAQWSSSTFCASPTPLFVRSASKAAALAALEQLRASTAPLEQQLAAARAAAEAAEESRAAARAEASRWELRHAQQQQLYGSVDLAVYGRVKA